MWDILQTYWVQLTIGYYPDGPLGGLALTLILAVAGLALALPAGLIVCLGLISPWRPLMRVVELFVFYMRSVPLIIHLLWIYFLLPLMIKGAPLWLVVLVVLTLFNGAYLSQAIRAGIEALPKGQYEAARSLGLSHAQALRRVILPQSLRNMTPSIVSQLVLLIKETALGSVIGMHEMTLEFMSLNDMLGNQAIAIFTLLGMAYFVLCYPLTILGRHLERRFAGVARAAANEIPTSQA
ncbi:MAG: amino acid ABC transporter permease [Burkholderiaceae bacterium]|jgi:polar amino acid transport system permease protein|nr:amino acid ABC transporter permease [Pseudomonadota bacterium]MBS0597788.1 amino acid ABC transporter permease [Pseudomonadota bacterium]MCO5117460.1 amino acid ABC transporter permease [Burkholderiaceae bacterium]MCP5219932.1 amino acid ABC transporter permease [Burkholderiaceae bacterium]